MQHCSNSFIKIHVCVIRELDANIALAGYSSTAVTMCETGPNDDPWMTLANYLGEGRHFSMELSTV